jgi:hypothetical protein
MRSLDEGLAEQLASLLLSGLESGLQLSFVSQLTIEWINRYMLP